MGHKVNPIGLRVGINRTWDSRWFASRGEYGKLLHEDMHIRDHIMKQQRQAGISKVVIERPHKKCRVTVHTARPGVLIGKKGADIEKLRGELAKLTSSEVHLNIVEVRKPEIDATLVAETIAQQLERRVAFRRAMKRVGAVGAAAGCARHPHQLLRAGSAAPRSRASSGTARAACRCTRCAPTSISATAWRRPPTASSASRCGSSRARSWSTIRWPPRSARSRRRRAAVAAGAAARRSRRMAAGGERQGAEPAKA